MRYKDKVTIVTGGSKGIGLGCAKVFVQEGGSKVVFCSRNESEGRAVEADLNKKGPGSATFVRADVSKVEDVKRVVDFAAQKFGRIDCLINNAGWHPPHKTIDDFSVEDFRSLLDLNLVSIFAACKQALPHLRKVKGNIINMSSLVGIMGQLGAATYVATKGGITALTKALAVDEAAYEVRVNAVSPGNVYTPLWQEAIDASSDPAKTRADGDAAQLLGRMGTIEEAGQLCLFLAAEATFTTGVDHILSGGAELAYGRKTKEGLTMPSVSAPIEQAPASGGKVSFSQMFRTADGRNHLFVFILVSTLFALWGFCNGQLEVLNKKFQNSLEVSISWSMLVQSVTFIGYAIMAIPAGKLTARFGYKGGIIIGLSLVAAGALWFYPATHIANYPVFLLGLFTIACGLACLETVANPYTTVLGPPQAAHTRINLAQSANGFGVMLGPIVGGGFLLSATGAADRSIENLYKPYFVIAGVVLVLAIAFALTKVPEVQEKGVEVAPGTSLWGRRHLVFAVVAQFFYVGAQIAVWSLFVNYMVAETPAMSASMAGMLPSGVTFEKLGAYYITEGGAAKVLGFGGYGLFFLGRLFGTLVIRKVGPQKTLALYALINAALMGIIVLRLGWISVAALFLSFFFMSIMFPTIFSLGIHGLGAHTKKASSFIVMAIGGGGVFPFLNGWISQHINMAAGFVVPLICFGVVLWYALSWEKLERKSRAA